MIRLIQYSLLFIIICGITIIRDRDLAEDELDYYKQMNNGLWIILVPFVILLFPIFGKVSKENQNIDDIEEFQIQICKNSVQTESSCVEQLQLYLRSSQDEKIEKNGINNQSQNQFTLTDHQKLESQNSMIIYEEENQQIKQSDFQKQSNQIPSQDLSEISHRNIQSIVDTERDSNNSQIIQTYSNSYNIKELNKSFEQLDNNQFQLSKIIEIIDHIPILVVQKYEEYIKNNRKDRRDLVFKNEDDFSDEDAIKYIKLLKNLFKFHDNLIRKGQKYIILKKKLDYQEFIKSLNSYLLDPISSNEILSHQRFVLSQLKFSLQSNNILLQFQVFEIYQILINFFSNPSKILIKIFLQLQKKSESLYQTAILQYYLEDYVYSQKQVEDEDFQRYLKIYHNSPEIINLQYNLDEKMNQFLFKQQKIIQT